MPRSAARSAAGSAPRPSADDGAPTFDVDLLAAIGPQSLLPPSLQPWSPLLLEGLAAFLNGLPPRRRQRIVDAQWALGLAADPSDRLLALLLECPTLHKLGQVVARQPRLDAALRRKLQALESLPPGADGAAGDAASVRRLHAAFDGRIDGLRIDERALAGGSVATVHAFEWRDDGRRADGVFKMLRPGIAQRLDDELALLPGIARLLSRRARELDLAALDFDGTLASIARLLRQETDLGAEQRNLRAAAAFHHDHPAVWIPRCLPFSTAHVTAMERVRGTSLADARVPPAARAALARTAMTELLARPFWTRDDPAVFHGDLHGGNLVAADDGRIAVLDWALTARVGKATREHVVAAVVGGATLDAGQVVRALAQLARAPDDDPVLRAAVDTSLDGLLARGEPAGFDWLLGLVDRIALDGRVHFDPELGVFRKSWLSMAGVLNDLSPGATPDAALAEVGLQQFVADWPARWNPLAGRAAFTTHLSNADLLHAMVSASATGRRALMRWPGAVADAGAPAAGAPRTTQPPPGSSSSPSS